MAFARSAWNVSTSEAVCAVSTETCEGKAVELTKESDKHCVARAPELDVAVDQEVVHLVGLAGDQSLLQ